MKVAGQEIEVQTDRYHGGWMSIAYLPDGKRVASAPWDTREAAEHDVHQQLLMRLAPAPVFDPTKTYENLIVTRRADNLLEHCGHCGDDVMKERTSVVPPKAMMGPTRKQIARRDFAVADTGPAPKPKPRRSVLRKPPVRLEEPPTEEEIAWFTRQGFDRVTAKVFALDARKRKAEDERRMRKFRRYYVPPKASFYPGSGGSAGVGGVTSA